VHPSQRSHQDIDDDDDDGVSLVSRSPSPTPDTMDIEKYDEYVRGPEREVITVETKIKSTNKGFEMLARLGWSEGQPLGLSADGGFNHPCRELHDKPFRCSTRRSYTISRQK
jgi:hypothetical protein